MSRGIMSRLPPMPRGVGRLMAARAFKPRRAWCSTPLYKSINDFGLVERPLQKCIRRKKCKNMYAKFAVMFTIQHSEIPITA